jgi:biopolymer transport protein ExbB/TolQ
MTPFEWMLFFVSLPELALLGLLIAFFWRLRKSEALLDQLQQNQGALLNKLHFNAELEQEIVASFEKRQKELALLDERLEMRKRELQKIISLAEEYCRSPRFLRHIITEGRRSGKSVEELAKSAGLTIDEVDLILERPED